MSTYVTSSQELQDFVAPSFTACIMVASTFGLGKGC